MARRNTIEVIIQAKDRASKQIKSFGGEVLNLKSALTGMAVVGAAKAAFELGRLGAMSLRTKATFAAISGGAGEAAANLDAMQKATRGAVADTELMAQASRLMQMGLAGNAEELGNVTEMAVRLGTAMGRDATQSMEEFALLLANQSIPRLDTFGISAGKVRSRILELMDATEGLTREAAFMQAVEEQGALAMERLGEATDDAALSFEQMETKIANAKIEIAEGLAPAVAGFLDLMATGIQEIPRVSERIEQAGVVAGVTALEFFGLRDASIALIDAFEGVEGAASGAGGASGFGGLDGAIDEVVRTAQEAPQAFDEMIAGLEGAANRAGYVARQQWLVTEAMEATNTQVALLGAALSGPVKQQNLQYEKSQESIREKIAELNTELKKYQARTGILVTSQDKLTIAQFDSATAAARLAEAQQVLAENTDPEKQLQFEAAVARASQAQDRANQSVNAAQPFITNYSKKIGEITGEIEEWETELSDLEAQHKQAMNSIVFDLVQARLAIDGWTEAEIGLALVTAESMGLIDQETLETAEAINESLLKFAEGQGVAQTRGQLQQIGRDIAGIPRTVDVDIQVRTHTDAMFRSLGILQGEAEVAAYLAANPPGSQGGGVGFGLTRVGEGGPELVNLPPRSRVFSNEASRMINSNNRSANLTIHTNAPHEPIIDDFRMMESFMGA